MQDRVMWDGKKILRQLAGHSEIFYGTNAEVLLCSSATFAF